MSFANFENFLNYYVSFSTCDVMCGIVIASLYFVLIVVHFDFQPLPLHMPAVQIYRPF